MNRFLRASDSLVGLLAVWLVLALVASPAMAQQYTVKDAGLDGGGGVTTAGPITLSSSLGGTSPTGTVRSGSYVLYSGMPSPFAGQAAILVIHDPQSGGGLAEAGEDQSITARIITNDAPLASATLHYRSGDAGQPTTVQMTEVDSGFVATIPGSSIGDAGFTYYFTAEDQEGTTVRVPRNGVYSLRVRLPNGIVKQDGQPAGSDEFAYRLISMPIVIDGPAPRDVLGDDIPTLSSPAAYDPTEARFFEPIGTRVAEFPSTGNFEVGQAFWLIVRDGVESIDSGSGTVNVLNEPVVMPLDQGWNFVGTPFPVPVPVTNVETTDGSSVTLRSYGASGYNTPQNPVTEMAPFEGYAVFVNSDTKLIVNPPLQTDDQAQRKQARPAQRNAPWQLRIEGSGPSGRDFDNVASVHPDAADGWDSMDWLQPPSVDRGLSISFDPPDGAPSENELSADVRSVPTRGTTWPLTVKAEDPGPVRLSVDGVRSVPSSFEVWLLDVQTKETWNLRTSPGAQIDLLGADPKRELRLFVGTTAYVEQTLSDHQALPQKYVLRPPYPNPSTGRVAVEIGLPEAGPVTIDVYNVLGQRVARLKDHEPVSAGFHAIVWEAPRLASGVYFVRMEAGSFTGTQKLVRVR